MAGGGGTLLRGNAVSPELDLVIVGEIRTPSYNYQNTYA